MHPPRRMFINTASNQDKFFDFLSPKGMAVLLAGFFCVMFYAFGSNTLIGDGLRYLPALRTITGSPPSQFQAKPWLEVYRSHYDGVVAHHHILFCVTMRAAVGLQQRLGIPRHAIIAIRSLI